MNVPAGGEQASNEISWQLKLQMYDDDLCSETTVAPLKNVITSCAPCGQPQQLGLAFVPVIVHSKCSV